MIYNKELKIDYLLHFYYLSLYKSCFRNENYKKSILII